MEIHKNTQISFIQILRGLAVLLVVWSHLSGYWLSANAESSAIQDYWMIYVTRPLHIWQNGGNLGVLIFFLVSGYIITYTALKESKFTFFVKRFMRLAPMLWVSTLLMAIYATSTQWMGTQALSHSEGNIFHWVTSLFLLDGFFSVGRVLEVTWTLTIEVMFYLLTFFSLNMMKKNPEKSTWWMTVSWIVFSLLSLTVPLLKTNGNTYLIFYVSFLLIGRNIFLWQTNKIRPIVGALNTAIPLFLYCIFVETAWPGSLLAPLGHPSGVEPVVTYAYAIGIFLCLLAISPKKAWKPLKFLGEISYSLYLLHIPVGMLVADLLYQLGWPSTFVTIGAITASVSISWITYRLIEVPSQTIARNYLAHRTEKIQTN